MADRSRSRSRSPDRGAPPADAPPADAPADGAPPADDGAPGMFNCSVIGSGICSCYQCQASYLKMSSNVLSAFYFQLQQPQMAEVKK